MGIAHPKDTIVNLGYWEVEFVNYVWRKTKSNFLRELHFNSDTRFTNRSIKIVTTEYSLGTLSCTRVLRINQPPMLIGIQSAMRHSTNWIVLPEE